MITVGLVKELLFMSKMLGKSIVVHLSCGTSHVIGIKINNEKLTIGYDKDIIWEESLDEATSMFGIESCHNILRIISLIDSGDSEKWRELAFHEKD